MVMATKTKEAPVAGPHEGFAELNVQSDIRPHHTAPRPQAQYKKERWNAPDGTASCSPVWMNGDSPASLSEWEAVNLHLECVQMSVALRQRAAADPGPQWPDADDPVWMAGEDDDDGIGLGDLEEDTYRGPKPHSPVERAVARLRYASNRVSRRQMIDLVLSGVL